MSIGCAALTQGSPAAAFARVSAKADRAWAGSKRRLRSLSLARSIRAAVARVGAVGRSLSVLFVVHRDLIAPKIPRAIRIRRGSDIVKDA